MYEQLQHTTTPEKEFSPELINELGEDAVREVVEIPDAGFDSSKANYEGNWSELALYRMAGPDFRQKFIQWIEETSDTLPSQPTERVSIAKGSSSDYRDNIKNFSQLHEAVSSHINYVPSDLYGKKPSNFGKSTGIGKPAIVFSDSILTSRQKDIIAAHEMHHSLIAAQGDTPRRIVLPAFDTNKVADWNDEQRDQGGNNMTPYSYMSDPRELMARMAQLKNYYGMANNEQFTDEHLHYAKDHYISDTGLDNSMTLFFRMIIDHKFISLINRLPV